MVPMNEVLALFDLYYTLELGYPYTGEARADVWEAVDYVLPTLSTHDRNFFWWLLHLVNMNYGEVQQ